MYQVHTVRPILFCDDVGACLSSIEDKALERTVRHSGCESITIIELKRDSKIGGTLVGSRGMVELMLQIFESTRDVPVILDVLVGEIST